MLQVHACVSGCDQCGDALEECCLSGTAGAARLHRVLAGLAARAEVATGTCALSSCHAPVVAYIQGGGLYPKGICAAHRPEVERVGYVTGEVCLPADDAAAVACCCQRAVFTGGTGLDQWIKRGLGAELAQMDAAFDFEAGLADVYARAGVGHA